MEDIMPKITNKNTPEGKGLRTAAQAMVGFIVGLFVYVWAVPGVPEAVINYLSDNWLPLLLATGVPAGAVAWVQNLLEKR